MAGVLGPSGSGALNGHEIGFFAPQSSSSDKLIFFFFFTVNWENEKLGRDSGEMIGVLCLLIVSYYV